MKTIDSYFFIRFEGDPLAPASYVGDRYREPCEAMRKRVIEHLHFGKPVCIIVPFESFLEMASSASFSVERNELGVMLSCYKLPVSDTRVATESLFTEPDVTPEVQRQVDRAFETAYGG